MDLFNPADPRPVHFLGIGGAGMSALALIARRRGVALTGCDADPSGAADLSSLGVTVHAGHDPSHLEGARAVVVTAAVPADHPELRRARELDLPVIPRKVALAALVGDARSVGVSGTHGKTTTTVMTTEALASAGLSTYGPRRRPGGCLGRQRQDRRGRAVRGRGRRVRPGVSDTSSDCRDRQQRRGRPPGMLRLGGRARECVRGVRRAGSGGAAERGRSRRAAGGRAGEGRPPVRLRRRRGGQDLRRGAGRRGHRGHRAAGVADGPFGSRCGCRASTTCGTPWPRSARWRRWVGLSSRRRRHWRRSRAWGAGSSGWGSMAASRSWTTTRTIRRNWWPRLPPPGRPSRAAGWSPSFSRISSPAPSRTAKRWGGRSRRPIWSS